MHSLDHPTELLALYEKPAPFTSVFVDETDESGADSAEVASRARARLAAHGAPPAALDAIEARLSLPVFGDVGGRAVIAAADGSTLVDVAHEGPRVDTGFVDTLPYAAPLLEWQQAKVHHIAVVADPDIFEAVSFHPGCEPELRPLGTDAADAASALARETRDVPVELIVLTGDPERVAALQPRLPGVVPTSSEVVALPADGELDLSTQIVRAVADKVARRTVGLLQEFRFLREHGSATEGVGATLEALAAGVGDVLLVHDDPTDARRAWFGPSGRDVATSMTPTCHTEGRLVDVAIRSALMQGIDVRVVPSTAHERGPGDDIGLLVRDLTMRPAAATAESTS